MLVVKNAPDTGVELTPLIDMFNVLDVLLNEKLISYHKIGYHTIDLVLIENQIGPLALRMKTLQGMIMQHFIEKKNTKDNGNICI